MRIGIIVIKRCALGRPVERQHMSTRAAFKPLPLARALPGVLIPWALALPGGDGVGVGIITTNLGVILTVVANDVTDDVVPAVAQHGDLMRLDEALGLDHDVIPACRLAVGVLILEGETYALDAKGGKSNLCVLLSERAIIGRAACSHD